MWVTDFVRWWDVGRTSAAAAVVGALAAVAAAWFAVRALRSSQADSKARSRPMMAAELRDHPYVDATQLLVIRNYGPSIARDVQVSFRPEIPDPKNPHESVTPFLKRRYAKPISVLVPGAELDNIYFSGEQVGSEWVNREPTPDQVRVTIAYRGDEGDQYVDHFDLDVMLIRGRTYATSSTEPDQRLKAISQAVNRMSQSLAGIYSVARGHAQGTAGPLPLNLKEQLIGRPEADAAPSPSEPRESPGELPEKAAP